MVGLFDRFTPNFVKRYANCWDVISKALADFQADVHKGQFPLAEHSFTMKEDEYQAFLQKLDKKNMTRTVHEQTGSSRTVFTVHRSPFTPSSVPVADETAFREFVPGCASAAKPGLILFRRQWFCDEVTLGFVAAQLGQEHQCAVILHALGYHPQSHVVPEFDGGAPDDWHHPCPPPCCARTNGRFSFPAPEVS
jgi:hypothetical protein